MREAGKVRDFVVKVSSPLALSLTHSLQAPRRRRAAPQPRSSTQPEGSLIPTTSARHHGARSRPIP